MAKVKRNLRLGPIFEVAEQELMPGETITHFIEDAMHREVERRRRARRRDERASAPQAEAGEAPE
jgi:hypothetical protein